MSAIVAAMLFAEALTLVFAAAVNRTPSVAHAMLLVVPFATMMLGGCLLITHFMGAA